ncbi:7-carboxy-7-deazaguanine synthase [Candidatus Woesebacteria bacterium CG22_combo_CG10-13_8_21_14_all_39_10]|uniref:7-carboxy-7-deazaguanine synthase n=2 Tax=Candidatus Woeseibacteriota TaxID=1752722 RepID=A0A2H0BJH1_9BACT|nr:MAG: 7-carboxy-7-deazaguanine synthase [Candidatus Woesebacteria bacterium CG22_combo_CG10-13_8_21_14_all_39_10]PIZ50310.1 MAG: 7-carboxy-7-deazaguanine synthase [Candidatus Woesebacteria bacterium CG_4_10_14_0_2_um_filter_39_14]
MTKSYKPTPDERLRLKLKPDQFKVSGDQVFFTIQGEGESIGKPAVFLRLHFCNLHCGWCDTGYTWNKNLKEFWQEGKNWSFQRVLQEVSGYPAKRLVITGGEPMLQQEKTGEFIKLIPDWEVEIETNGTIAPLPLLARKCQFNVSPKLGNSGNSLRVRYKPEVLKVFNALPKTTFKFVVQAERDLEEIGRIESECGLDPSKIIITPEGSTQNDIKNHALSVSEQVKQRGWRLLPRLQIMLWGKKRRL